MSNQSIYASITPKSEVVKKLILEPKKADSINREIKNRYEIYCSMHNITKNVIEQFEEGNISKDEFIECLISFYNSFEAVYCHISVLFKLSTYTKYRSSFFHSCVAVEAVLDRKIELKDLRYPKNKISFNIFKRDFLKIDLEAARPVEAAKTRLNLILTKKCINELLKKVDGTANKLIERGDIKELRLFWATINLLDPETRNLMREKLSPFNLILIDFIASVTYNRLPVKSWWSESYKELSLEDIQILISKTQPLYGENVKVFYNKFFSSSFVLHNLHPEVYVELQITYLL